MITGAILAGGLATRLRSVWNRPKVLAPVGGRPFITYLLDQLSDAGLQQVVLCTGFMAEDVRRALGDEYRGMQLLYSREDQPLGTGGALCNALHCSGAGLWLVLNGDSYAAADLTAFIEWRREHGFAGSLLLCRVEDCSRFGAVEVDASQRISGFFEKRGIAEPGWINGGVYLLSRELLESLPQGTHSVERDVFPRWVKRGLGGYCVQAPFIDIGTPESLAQADEFVRREHGRAASRGVL